ncbi:hypothetical protein Tco_1416334 [Tanacetum coccineum]
MVTKFVNSFSFKLPLSLPSVVSSGEYSNEGAGECSIDGSGEGEGSCEWEGEDVILEDNISCNVTTKLLPNSLLWAKAMKNIMNKKSPLR